MMGQCAKCHTSQLSVQLSRPASSSALASQRRLQRKEALRKYEEGGARQKPKCSEKRVGEHMLFKAIQGDPCGWFTTGGGQSRDCGGVMSQRICVKPPQHTDD